MIEEQRVAGVSVDRMVDEERALLGSILIEPDVLYTVSDYLPEGADTFYNRQAADVYRAILEIDGRGGSIDLVSVAAELDKLKSTVSPADLTGLLGEVPSYMHAETYARKVGENRRRLRLAGMLEKAFAGLSRGDEFERTISVIDEGLLNVGELDQAKERDTRTLLRDVVNSIEDRQKAKESGYTIGLRTGLEDLDKIIRGSRSGDLLVLGGRPGMGKTTAALQIAYHVATQGLGVIFYSFEMSDEELATKLLSHVGRISYSDLREGVVDELDWPILLEAAEDISSKPLFIEDRVDPSPHGVRNSARAKVARAKRDGQPIGLIIVDYLQLMSIYGYRENRTNEVSAMSRSLKQLARETGAVVLCLSQLSRSLESRADKRPVMSDLRESGGIEQDADVVFFCYRDGYYNPDDPEKANVSELIVSKNRHGGTGTASFFFDPVYGAFKPLVVERHDFS